MTTAHLFRILTTRLGGRELVNLSRYAIVAPAGEEGCKLYPRSHNERYDGIAVQVKEGLDAFAGLPGFVSVWARSPELAGTALLNMAKVEAVRDGADGRSVAFPNSTSTLRIENPLEEILEGLRAVASPLLVQVPAPGPGD